MAESFIRLELDKNGIKASIVEQSTGNASIKEYCHVEFKDLPEKKPENGDNIGGFNAGMDVVAQKLNLGLCTKAVVFVSDYFISYRNIELPFKSEKKIKQILPFELETYLPYHNKTAISDFHMLNFTNNANMPDASNLVLTASIDQSLIEKYFLKLGEYNIVPIIVAPLGYAAAIGFLIEISRSKEFNKQTDFAFVHIIDHEITLVLIQNRQPCAIRTVVNSNISSDQLATMVEQTVIGFNQRTGRQTVFPIHICMDKDTLNHEHILNAFETDLNDPYIPEVVLNSNALLSHILLDKNEKYLFNFCKGKYGSSSFFKTYGSNIAVSAVLLLCLFIFLVMGAGFDNKKLENEITQIDKRAFSLFNETFPGKTKIHDPYLQMKANVQSFMKNAESGINGNKQIHNIEFKVVEMLGEISSKITDSMDIDIARFLFNKERLVLSGTTDNFKNVDKIKSVIESSPMFKTVNIRSAAADKKSNRINFKFIIEM